MHNGGAHVSHGLLVHRTTLVHSSCAGSAAHEIVRHGVNKTHREASTLFVSSFTLHSRTGFIPAAACGFSIIQEHEESFSHELTRRKANPQMGADGGCRLLDV